MIKIIEEGHKQFRNTCFKCGCKYTYELEDVNTKTDCVKCPQCGANNVHLPRANAILPPPDPYIGQIALPLNTKDNNQSNNPCANCNYIKKLMLDQTYVGDIPCTWCECNPLKVTCTNVYTATNTNTNVTIDTGKTEGGGITFDNGKN